MGSLVSRVEPLNDAKRIQEGLEKAQLSGRGGDNPKPGRSEDHFPPEQEHVTSGQGTGIRLEAVVGIANPIRRKVQEPAQQDNLTPREVPSHEY